MDAPPAIVVDIDAFGLSRHSNHRDDYRQRNPGLGLTVGIPLGDGATGATNGVPAAVDWVTSAGTYLDSFDCRARYALTGLRFLLGPRDWWHWGLAVEMGYYDGSGMDGVALVPVLQFGYDRVTLCVTGEYSSGASSSTGGRSLQNSPCSMVAVFLEVEVLRF
jgi:hypothetical protein